MLSKPRRLQAVKDALIKANFQVRKFPDARWDLSGSQPSSSTATTTKNLDAATLSHHFPSQQICGEGSREKKGSCLSVESGNVSRTRPTPTGVRGRRVGQNLQKMFALFVSISAVRRLGSDQRMSPHQANVTLVEIPSLLPMQGSDGSTPVSVYFSGCS